MGPNPSLKPFCAWLWSFLVIFLATAFAQQPAVSSRITQPVDEARLTPLRGNTHPLALPKFDRGAAPVTLLMDSMLLVLKRSAGQETALQKLMEAQQDKSSPNYHKWLSSEEFGKQFGPSDQDIQTVTAWLQSHGFQIGQVSRGRTVIEFSGDAGMVRQAFHTEIHKFVSDGEEHWANATDPEIPSGLAPVVAGVNTLHNFPRRALSHNLGVVSRAKDTGVISSAQPLFTIPGGCGVQTTECYGVGPYDFATIYNVLPLWTGSPAIDGTGQTIAIVGETDINSQDVIDFRSFFGLPTSRLQVIHNGPAPGTLHNGEESEALLDVQWSGAVAPGATIDYVVTASTESSLGVDLSAQYIVDNNLAPIMSESYGLCELAVGTTGNQFFNQLWQQAAAQGITVFLASGDSGSAVCDAHNASPPAPAQYGLQVSGFSSTPYNISVGGTDFYDWTTAATYWSLTNDSTTKASAKGYIPETTWNDTCTNGVFGALLGFSKDAETNCNNSRLLGFVDTVAGSGGKSSCTTSDRQTVASCSGGYPKPSWQTALTPNDGKRDVPDVSLYAAAGSPSGSFYVICQADQVVAGTSCNPRDASTQFFAIGGTSASSPAMAGIMALVDQKTASRQGNANYVFYKLAAQQQNSACDSTNGSGASCVFNDVTNGTIAMPCLSGAPNCTVAHSGDRYGVLSGYSATAGFDLATGLGSVNAANLVSKWSSVSFTQSATTLNSVTPTTITHGQPATVTVTVAPKSGTGSAPTGAVSLTRGPSSTDPGIESHTLSNGTASWGTSHLPGGAYSLAAHYNGDGTYGPSDSSPISVTVNKENSQTQAFLVTFDPTTGRVLNPTATTAQYGSPYILRVNVANSGGVLCGAFRQLQSDCPSGGVSLTDNGSPLDGGQFTLNSVGYLEDFLVQLSGGMHSVVASYAGDASYKASSANTAMTITPALTTVTAPNNATSLTVGDIFSASVTVQTQSSGVAPGGTVSFFANGVPLSGTVTYAPTPASPSAPAWLGALINTSVSAPGTYHITGTYKGDLNYSSATSATTTATAKYQIPTLTITPSSQTVAPGTSVTVVALIATTSGASAPAPTGPVPFLDAATNAPLTGTETYTTLANPNGPQLQATFTFTPTVTELVTAQYAGDSNYPSAQNFGPSTVTVTGNDFSLAPNPPSVTVTAPGSSAGTMLIVSGQSSYNGTINFTPASCSGLPAETTCSFAPATVTGAGFTQLTINTKGPHLLFTKPAVRSHLSGGPAALGGLLLAGVFVLGWPGRRRRPMTLLAFLAVALLGGSVSCGGGGSGGGGPQTDPGTPRGSSTVTVSGTSGTTTHTTTLTLIVQ
jgi:hypothetical protein